MDMNRRMPASTSPSAATDRPLALAAPPPSDDGGMAPAPAPAPMLPVAVAGCLPPHLECCSPDATPPSNQDLADPVDPAGDGGAPGCVGGRAVAAACARARASAARRASASAAAARCRSAACMRWNSRYAAVDAGLKSLSGSGCGRDGGCAAGCDGTIEPGPRPQRLAPPPAPTLAVSPRRSPAPSPAPPYAKRGPALDTDRGEGGAASQLENRGRVGAPPPTLALSKAGDRSRYACGDGDRRCTGRCGGE